MNPLSLFVAVIRAATAVALLWTFSANSLAQAPMVRVCPDHSMALASDGNVYEWGDLRPTFVGAFDFGFSTPFLDYFSVSGVTGARAIACSVGASFMLRSDGSVWSYGYDAGGLRGAQFVDVLPPAPISGLSSIAAISVSLSLNPFALALDNSGRVWGWGSNSGGQLTGPSSDSVFPPVRLDLPTASPIVRIAAGITHTLVLDADGNVWIRGLEGQPVLGNVRNHPAFERVPGLPRIVEIAAGVSSFAIDSSGALWAWGDNSIGQLGIGFDAAPSHPAFRDTPVRVSALGSVRSVAAGFAHTLAIKTDGTLWAWGNNDNGELGLGTVDPPLLPSNPTPAQVPIPGPVIQVVAGVASSVAYVAGGGVFAWGWNSFGLLGDGTFANRLRPQAVVGVAGTGFLDVTPEDPLTASSFGRAVFGVVASGARRASPGDPLSVDAEIHFRAQDVGNPIRIFAYAPATLVKSASVSKDGPTCVLAQLTSNGLQQVSASNLQPYVSNVTSTQQQAVTVLNNVNATQVAGATFCVGTAATSAQAVDPANSVCVVTVSDPASPVCTAPDAAAAAASYEGLWLKGDESGWGVNVTHQGTTLFATWFTYDTDGSGMWLVASSLTQTSAGNFSGALYRTVGPAFSANPFNSISFPANYTTVGTLTFSFTDANTGTMSYTVNGVTQSKAITRFIYASGGTNCTLGGTQGASPNYQDLWLRSAAGTTEAGWGINITHQGDILFATWFTYLAGSGSTNKGMWIVMSNGAKTSPGVYSGALQTTTGPAFSATPFNPNNVARTTVGTGTFTFTDANNGTFNYTVNGVTQSKPIARFIYATPSTTCQ